jgi:hypothetical protein
VWPVRDRGGAELFRDRGAEPHPRPRPCFPSRCERRRHGLVPSRSLPERSRPSPRTSAR